MSELDKERLQTKLIPKLNKFVPHIPTPKQSAFLSLEPQYKEAFFGGACGGGKSDALLMACLMHTETPGFNAIIFRKTYSALSLPGGLMDRAHEWLYPFVKTKEVHWSEKNKTYTFKPSEATLTFGYLESGQDRFRYQSANFMIICFDELTQFEEVDYLYLFSRLRRTKEPELMKIPLRMLSASNPGNIGAQWVRQRFLIEGKEKGRVFIPAVMYDNPYLDTDSYLLNLNELSPLERAQLLEGDWEVNSGGKVFKREWFEILNKLPETLSYIPTVRYWDLAATEKGQGRDGYEPAFTVGLRMKKYKDFFLVDDVRRFQKDPSGVEAEILSTAMQDGRNVEIWMEEEPGSSGKNTINNYQRLLSRFTFRGQKETGSKVLRASKTAADAGNGKIKILQGIWNNPFLDEVDFFPDSHFKDQVDALSGAHHKLNNFAGYNIIPIAVGQETGSYWTES